MPRPEVGLRRVRVHLHGLLEHADRLRRMRVEELVTPCHVPVEIVPALCGGGLGAVGLGWGLRLRLRGLGFRGRLWLGLGGIGRSGAGLGRGHLRPGGRGCGGAGRSGRGRGWRRRGASRSSRCGCDRSRRCGLRGTCGSRCRGQAGGARGRLCSGRRGDRRLRRRGAQPLQQGRAVEHAEHDQPRQHEQQDDRGRAAAADVLEILGGEVVVHRRDRGRMGPGWLRGWGGREAVGGALPRSRASRLRDGGRGPAERGGQRALWGDQRLRHGCSLRGRGHALGLLGGLDDLEEARQLRHASELAPGIARERNLVVAGDAPLDNPALQFGQVFECVNLPVGPAHLPLSRLLELDGRRRWRCLAHLEDVSTRCALHRDARLGEARLVELVLGAAAVAADVHGGRR